MFELAGLDPVILTLGAVLTLSLLWWRSTRRPSGTPPGPSPALPLVGHIYLMDKDFLATFRAWRRKYGDVFSLYMGSRLVVVLNGYPVLKEALVKLADVFSDRPDVFVFETLLERKGIASTSGIHWREQRKRSLEILRVFGMGKNILAERIQEEITHYIQAIQDLQGAPTDLASLTEISVSNNICSITFGKRFQYDDKAFSDLIAKLHMFANYIASSALINYIPQLHYLPGDLFNAKKITNCMATIKTFCRHQLEAHLKEPRQNSDNTDFIYAYLSHLDKLKTSNPDTTLNDSNLLHCNIDLFMAGTETTSTTIRWALLFFLHYSQVQDKCYKEICDVIGTNRAPSMSDKPKLVYLEATIMETLRRADIAPTAAPHGLTCDVTFRGYFIPKDAIVIPNLDSVLNDPEIWGDPENFRPERFIGPDGKLTRPDEFIPFSLGRRICLGESLARTELFLYMVNLIQHFHFIPLEKEPLPSLKGILGITLCPVDYKVRAVPRS